MTNLLFELNLHLPHINKEYPKGSSKDDKRKLRSVAKKYVIKERKLNRDHSPNFFRQASLLFHKWLSLIQPATQHHRGMLKEHLYKILACPCNRRKQFKRQRD
jgi:hypothetical protein